MADIFASNRAEDLEVREDGGDRAWFDIPSCPLCGGELFEGEADNVRLDSNKGHDMVGDIDSGNRIVADLKVKHCQVCEYTKVRVEAYGYAGY